ncbi:ABC transporter substrate-binding protein [Telmatospirillum sp.]|uniref:ABC transporter substrate-binding protein n=1 Tax=Telmatospirillum sp. TaxID=2079197 RepID=UPI00284F678F|nr:ABC transporter substrate-binding protein [Telmatospirillum sp.]MDR3437311.1 ABC transporter substrate-binding protein [Telmatospirillum sp.]
MRSSRLKSVVAALGAACLVAISASGASAADKVKFTLDWKFEGNAAPFLLAQDKGYFAAEGLDVTIDSGNGSAGAVTRVASGAYDIGMADINSLVEFDASNPDRSLKAFFIVYDAPPFALFTFKKSGITKPKDFEGKTLGAPVFDAPRKLFPAFARATGIATGAVKWESMDPPLREPMLVRGQVDAISGFYFTSLLNLKAQGVKLDDLVIFKFADYGMAFYGNGLIASPALMQNNPDVLKRFSRAVIKGWREAIKDPAAAIEAIKKRDPLIDPALERERLDMVLKDNVLTAEVKANGMGGIKKDRMAKSIEQLSDAFSLPKAPTVDDVFTDAFLPSKADRMLQ